MKHQLLSGCQIFLPLKGQISLFALHYSKAKVSLLCVLFVLLVFEFRMDSLLPLEADGKNTHIKVTVQSLA